MNSHQRIFKELGFGSIKHRGKDKETQTGVEVYCAEMQETFLVSVFVDGYSSINIPHLTKTRTQKINIVKYRVIISYIVLKPKILSNVVWTITKNIAQGCL